MAGFKVTFVSNIFFHEKDMQAQVEATKCFVNL